MTSMFCTRHAVERPKPTDHFDAHFPEVIRYQALNVKKTTLGVMRIPNLGTNQSTVAIECRLHLRHKLTSRLDDGAQPIDEGWNTFQMTLHLFDHNTDGSLMSNPKIRELLVGKGWVREQFYLCISLFQAPEVNLQRANVIRSSRYTASNYLNSCICKSRHIESFEHVVVLASESFDLALLVLPATHQNSRKDCPYGAYSLNPRRSVGATPRPIGHPPTQDHNRRGNHQSPEKRARANGDYNLSGKHSHLLTTQEGKSLPAPDELVHGELAA